MTKQLKFIDLFAGIGGIRLGFSDKHTKCVYSSEWDKFAQQTYQANFHERPHGDITKVNANDIPDFDVLLAGFPCQPFSAIGKRQGFQNPTQGTLFFDVLRILKTKRPQAFLLENVPGLLTIQNGQTFQIICDCLTNADYQIHFKVLSAEDCGVPQSRKRIIIVGFRNDIDATKFHFPKTKQHPIPIKAILEHEPNGYSISKHLQQTYLFKQNDGRPYVVDFHSTGVAKTLNASYHKIQRLTGTFVKDGPTGLRLFSQNECKALQGFPIDYQFPVSRTQMYKQLGNSVTVPMIKGVSHSLKAVLRHQPTKKP